MQAEARHCHKKFKDFGQKSLHVLDNNISNPRYPGFSEFFSSNALQNSSYCWTIGKDQRIKDKSYKKYNDNIYNIPDFRSTRYTTQGYGTKKDFWVQLGKGDPSPDTYKIESLFDFNVNKKRGSSLGERLNYLTKDSKYKPGPGQYESKDYKSFGNIPILIKSRQLFFYDDDLKKKKYTVSMQRYSPNYKLAERRRFNAISFGIGERPNMHTVQVLPQLRFVEVPHTTYTVAVTRRVTSVLLPSQSMRRPMMSAPLRSMRPTVAVRMPIAMLTRI